MRSIIGAVYEKFEQININTIKVGLAVGDINEVRQNADISIIQMDLNFIIKVKTCYLPRWIHEYVYKPTFVIRNHDKISANDKVR